MRLKLLHNPSVHGHTAYCAGVGWTKTGQQHELYSVSDDQSILKWNADGSLNGKVCDYSGSSESAKGGNTFCTSMQFLPAASGRGAAADSYLALACADGSFRLLNKSGKEEKRVDNAHTGAVICIRWNHDGSAIATAGEDGLVKIWSRSAMPRSTIAQHSRSVYAVCWSPDSEAVVYAYEKRLVIKPLQPRQRAIEWHAHEGVALQVDWSPVNNLIVSAGEDRQYKIWDSYGRPVFSGPPLETVATCISWAPNGRCFAVGCHNTVKLCDRTGWTYGRETAETGSITQVAWSPDGTRFGASGGNGSVVFGFVSERSMLWQHLDATLEDSGTIVVRDLNRQASETLHFRDRVMDFSLGFGALVATTSTQLHIYNSSNWSACHTEDLKEPATLIAQAPSLLALVDSTAISVYSYEGRLLSTIRVPGLRTEFLNHSTLAVAKDAVCIVDAQNPRVIRLFDAHTGKAMGSPVEHKVEVEVVALNHHGGGGDRKIALMDKNKDVFISLAHKPGLVKLAQMVETFAWNDETDMLAGVADNKLVCWTYPAALFIDPDLLPLATSTKEAGNCGKLCQIAAFSGPHVTVRRLDGALVFLSVSPYAVPLYKLVDGGQWEKAIRLCRFVKAPHLWASLAAMGLNARELQTAEISLAALDEVDKVQYIAHVTTLKNETLRAAELALFCRKPEEAVQILLRNKMVYRAIKMLIRLHRWESALELAVHHKTHVDTVLGYRAMFLEEMRHKESNPKFEKISKEINVDWDAIKAKIAAEKEQENEGGGD